MIDLTIPIPKPVKRNFLPQDFQLKTWEDLKPYLDTLSEADIDTIELLNKWLAQKDELEAFVGEEEAWRYINYSRDTEDTKASDKYSFFTSKIKPELAPYDDVFNKKLLSSKVLGELEGDSGFKIYIRAVKNQLELYREENIALFAQVDNLTQEYAAIQAKMTIRYERETYTLQQAATFLKDPDREVRKEVYELVGNRRLEDKEELNNIFDKLVQVRHQIALNAGFQDYAQYKFVALGRFDYTQEQVFDFHHTVSSIISPMVDKIVEAKRLELGLDVIKPYDMDAVKVGDIPLKPFADGDELLKKGIKTFKNLHPALASCLEEMNKRGLFDLESRKGKAPGGYNYPLDESGVPFIFMNAAGKLRDMVTLMHEGGHAIHSFLSNGLQYSAYKHTPSEVAELASMSMELLSTEYWDVYFHEGLDLVRAKKEHLEGVIESLPWIACVDKFQHWVYTNYNHTTAEREEAWKKIYFEFNTDSVDSTDYMDYIGSGWQKQLHIYEVPFYYIEYGIAQLGALSIWRNFKNVPAVALKNYTEALKLGYTKTIPEIYKEAGVEFNFKKEYIEDLMSFANHELEKLVEAEEVFLYMNPK